MMRDFCISRTIRGCYPTPALARGTRVGDPQLDMPRQPGEHSAPYVAVWTTTFSC